MEVICRAPNRIDLAGGTTDLYPLFLFMDGGCTVNAAVTVMSRVRIVETELKCIRIESEDLNLSIERESADELPLDGPLGLVSRAIKAFPPPKGATVLTRNDAPAGSGLGASSSLLIALLNALFRIRGDNFTDSQTVDLAMKIETASLGVPAGSQDHIAALFGGVSVINFGYADFVREPVSDNADSLKQLQSRLILSFTGEGRFSGLNNWEVTKGYIDDKDGIREKLFGIKEVAVRIARSIRALNWEETAELIKEEWNIRKTLAAGISNPKIERIMEEAAAAGAVAGKICGAGGGGCMITMVPPEKRNLVEQALKAAQAQVIPFSLDEDGLQIAISL